MSQVGNKYMLLYLSEQITKIFSGWRQKYQLGKLTHALYWVNRF